MLCGQVGRHAGHLAGMVVLSVEPATSTTTNPDTVVDDDTDVDALSKHHHSSVMLAPFVLILALGPAASDARRSCDVEQQIRRSEFVHNSSLCLCQVCKQ